MLASKASTLVRIATPSLATGQNIDFKSNVGTGHEC